MSHQFTYAEIANSWALWITYVDQDGNMTREEFDAMTQIKKSICRSSRSERRSEMNTTHTIPPEVQMAIGRLFLMLSRPEQPGDIETFHEIRSIVLDSSEQQTPDHRPNYVAQRMTGAQGDFA